MPAKLARDVGCKGRRYCREGAAVRGHRLDGRPQLRHQRAPLIAFDTQPLNHVQCGLELERRSDGAQVIHHGVNILFALVSAGVNVSFTTSARVL